MPPPPLEKWDGGRFTLPLVLTPLLINTYAYACALKLVGGAASAIKLIMGCLTKI